MNYSSAVIGSRVAYSREIIGEIYTLAEIFMESLSLQNIFFNLSCSSILIFSWPLHWRNNECDGVSIQQRLVCLLRRLFGPRSKKTSKLLVTGLCGGNSPVTGGFPSQRASYAERLPFDDVIMRQMVWNYHICIVVDVETNNISLNEQPWIANNGIR